MIVRASLVQQNSVGFVYYIPGIVATLAVLLMSLLRRDDSDYVGYGDEGDQVRVEKLGSSYPDTVARGLGVEEEGGASDVEDNRGGSLLQPWLHF